VTVFVLTAAVAAATGEGGWLAWSGPIVVALIAAGFAYRQATKVAERNAKVETERAAAENRRASTAEYAALTATLMEEINRLRADRREDQDEHAVEMGRVQAEMSAVQTACADQADDFRLLSTWARTVLGQVRRPEVAAVLAEHQVEIPPLPDPIERGRD
jgi:hypothetical protein